jgi:hypothetical protein
VKDQGFAKPVISIQADEEICGLARRCLTSDRAQFEEPADTIAASVRQSLRNICLRETVDVAALGGDPFEDAIALVRGRNLAPG